MRGSKICKRMPTFQSEIINLAITLGDPAGIGPEVTLKALHHLKRDKSLKFTLLGSRKIYQDVADRLKIKLSLDEFVFESAGELTVGVIRGRSDNKQTRMAVNSIRMSVEMAMSGAVDGVVTAPIHKAGLKKAGFNIPGHTEFMAELASAKKFEMMLVGGKLRVVLVTRHTAINKVASQITRARVTDTILLTDQELRRSFGIRKPRIVVCGLNPHAGESGTIGLEEMQVIEPAVRDARRKSNADIVGPLSADALFYDAYQGKYDAEVCMYHDQGLVPLKMISRGAGVNVTLGLPFVRTSPDHGTAYDIANRFVADPGSMIEAIQLARQITIHRVQFFNAQR